MVVSAINVPGVLRRALGPVIVVEGKAVAVAVAVTAAARFTRQREIRGRVVMASHCVGCHNVVYDGS